MNFRKIFRDRSTRRLLPAGVIIVTAIALTGFVQGFARAADTVLLSNDFESTFAPWGARGSVTLALADEAHGGSHSLSVTGRTANWNGTQTSVTSMFQAGTTYSVTLQAVDGTTPYHWSLPAGSLPPGLVLRPNLGKIVGKPTTIGRFAFTVGVADSAPTPSGDTQQLSIKISPAVP